MKYILIALFFTSCVTSNKVHKWIKEHPVEGATICLESFPQEEKIDTSYIVKDSVIFNQMTDTIYKWFTDYMPGQVITKERIKKVLQPCKDSIIIVNKTIYDEKYKILYNDKSKKYDEVVESLAKVRKWLLYIVLGILLYIGVKYIESKA